MEPSTSEVPNLEQQMKPSFFAPLNKVTNVSKTLALGLFIILPFVGFYIGFIQGQANTPLDTIVQTVQVTPIEPESSNSDIQILNEFWNADLATRTPVKIELNQNSFLSKLEVVPGLSAPSDEVKDINIYTNGKKIISNCLSSSLSARPKEETPSERLKRIESLQTKFENLFAQCTVFSHPSDTLYILDIFEPMQVGGGDELGKNYDSVHTLQIFDSSNTSFTLIPLDYAPQSTYSIETSPSGSALAQLSEEVGVTRIELVNLLGTSKNEITKSYTLPLDNKTETVNAYLDGPGSDLTAIHWLNDQTLEIGIFDRMITDHGDTLLEKVCSGSSKTQCGNNLGLSNALLGDTKFYLPQRISKIIHLNIETGAITTTAEFPRNKALTGALSDFPL